MSASADRTEEWKKAIRSFPPSARGAIDRMWENGGRLPADMVGNILGSIKGGIRALMVRLLPVAKQYAVVPVSAYRVGAVAAGMPAKNGERSLYLGANLEFSGAALSFTVHAEQSATNNAWLSGESGIHFLAISAAPCGYCRQFLNELATARSLKIVLAPRNKSRSFSTRLLNGYLPNAFSPGDLGVRGGLMDPALCTHSVQLDAGTPSDDVVASALVAASRSYAPYKTGASYAYAGVAVETLNGQIYAGRHAVNAAYNPSMSPLESALSFMAMSQPQGGVSPAVKRCALVEVPTLASQQSATESVLKTIAPGLKLEYYTAAIVS